MEEEEEEVVVYPVGGGGGSFFHSYLDPRTFCVRASDAVSPGQGRCYAISAAAGAATLSNYDSFVFFN